MCLHKKTAGNFSKLLRSSVPAGTDRPVLKTPAAFRVFPVAVFRPCTGCTERLHCHSRAQEENTSRATGPTVMVLWNFCKHIPDYTASPPSMQDFHSSICSQFCNSFALNRFSDFSIYRHNIFTSCAAVIWNVQMTNSGLDVFCRSCSNAAQITRPCSSLCTP